MIVFLVIALVWLYFWGACLALSLSAGSADLDDKAQLIAVMLFAVFWFISLPLVVLIAYASRKFGWKR